MSCQRGELAASCSWVSAGGTCWMGPSPWDQTALRFVEWQDARSACLDSQQHYRKQLEHHRKQHLVGPAPAWRRQRQGQKGTSCCMFMVIDYHRVIDSHSRYSRYSSRGAIKTCKTEIMPNAINEWLASRNHSWKWTTKGYLRTAYITSLIARTLPQLRK